LKIFDMQYVLKKDTDILNDQLLLKYSLDFVKSKK
jgi:hypothetical protein